MQILDEKAFREVIATSQKPVLVDFFATWCGPCKMLAPVLEQLAAEHPEVTVCKVDIDQSEQLAMEYRIMSVPTLLLFKNGEVANKTIGVLPKSELEKFIEG